MATSEQIETEHLKHTILQLEERNNQLNNSINQIQGQNLGLQKQMELEIDAHKNVADSIERGKREWEATFDAVSDMVILTDTSNRVIRCNFSTCRCLGKKYAELIGHSIHDLLWGEMVADPGVLQTEARDVQFHSLQGWYDVSNFKLVIKGNPYGTVHVIKDITERHLVQENLRNSEETLLKLNDELETRVNTRTLELIHANEDLEKEIKQREDIQEILAKEKELLSITLMSIQDGVISTDKDGVITLFNQAAENITGFSQEDGLGKTCQEIVRILDDTTGEVSSDPLKMLLQNNARKAQKHLTLINKNGDRILIYRSIAPVCTNRGELVGYVMIITNITEQKRIESKLALSQKMESIGQLSAGIAHEINTPMQYVGDNTHFFNEAFQTILDILNTYDELREPNLTLDDITQILDKIQKKKETLDLTFFIGEIPAAIQQSLDGIDRVRKIVLAMKSFSHPGQKEKSPADINQGIDATITISRNEWKYIAELETDLDPNLPMVNCEIGEINQVILNMIINSTHAIQDAKSRGKDGMGKIIIKTRAIGDHVEISIQDNGAGIPEANLSRVFDPFFTTKDVGKGTGQGLSLAHNTIVNQHKGSIDVKSVIGEGTSFIIQLPVNIQNEILSHEAE